MENSIIIPDESKDPNDPMALQADEGWIRGWWQKARLYGRRRRDEPKRAMGAGALIVMVLLLAAVAGVIVWVVFR